MKYKLALTSLNVCIFMEKLLLNWSNWFGKKGSFIVGRWM